MIRNPAILLEDQFDDPIFAVLFLRGQPLLLLCSLFSSVLIPYIDGIRRTEHYDNHDQDRQHNRHARMQQSSLFPVLLIFEDDLDGRGHIDNGTISSVLSLSTTAGQNTVLVVLVVANHTVVHRKKGGCCFGGFCVIVVVLIIFVRVLQHKKRQKNPNNLQQEHHAGAASHDVGRQYFDVPHAVGTQVSTNTDSHHHRHCKWYIHYCVCTLPSSIVLVPGCICTVTRTYRGKTEDVLGCTC